jgi:hypothetical protein
MLQQRWRSEIFGAWAEHDERAREKPQIARETG